MPGRVRRFVYAPLFIGGCAFLGAAALYSALTLLGVR
jgi:hypothetical protein